MKVGPLKAAVVGARETTPRLQHAVGFHGSATHLRRQLVALVDGATARGELVALDLAPATEVALRASVADGDALRTLTAPADPEGGHGQGGSGQTVALMRARELRTLSATGRTVTVLSEHRAALDGPDGTFWTELDAAVNVALADLPVRLVCFYPEMPLHLSVLEGARRNHPQVLVDGRLRHNAEFRSPRDVLAGHPAATPTLLGAPDLRLPFHAWQLHEVRHAVRGLAGAAGLTEDRISDVVLAVNEVATNAVEHGIRHSAPGHTAPGDTAPRHAELHVWVLPSGLVCEVHDGGTLTDPLPGLHPPHPSDPRGRGLWIARQICDLLHVWSDGSGTHVRVRAAP